MIRRSFQLSGSYDVIKDITDLQGKIERILPLNITYDYWTRQIYKLHKVPLRIICTNTYLLVAVEEVLIY